MVSQGWRYDCFWIAIRNKTTTVPILRSPSTPATGYGSRPAPGGQQGVMMSSADLGSAPSGAPKPKESRRWLKPRVPNEQLYRLAPARHPRTRLGMLDFSDRVRAVLQAWWAWLIPAVLLELFGGGIAG